MILAFSGSHSSSFRSLVPNFAFTQCNLVKDWPIHEIPEVAVAHGNGFNGWMSSIAVDVVGVGHCCAPRKLTSRDGAQNQEGFLPFAGFRGSCAEVDFR